MNSPGLAQGLLHALFFTWLGFIILFLTERDRDRLGRQLRLFAAAFAVRFLMSVVIYRFGLVTLLGDEDASGWVSGAFLAQDWQQHRVQFWDLPSMLAPAFGGQNQGYSYLLGALFYLDGAPYRLVAAALNAFCGALTVVLVYRTAAVLFSERVASKAGWWTCFFPSMIIWSAQTLKEPVVIFLETVALYGCTRLAQRGVSAAHLVLCASSIVLLQSFRFYAAYIVGATVLVTLLLPALVQKRNALAAVGLVAVLLPVIIGTGFLARSQAQIESFSLDRVQNFRHDVSTGGVRNGASSGVQTGDIRTPGGLLWGTVVGGAHLLLAPFPWELGGASIRMALTLPELLVWWWLFPVGVVPGLWYVVRRRWADCAAMLLLLLGFGLIYSMMFGNIGLVFRQRAQLLPWLLILAAVGSELRRKARRLPEPPSFVLYSPSAPCDRSPAASRRTS